MTSDETRLIRSDTPILLADDSFQFAQLLNKLLSGIFKFQDITIVASADEALRRIELEPGRFRLMFFDFHYPSGLNGGELLVTLSERGLLDGKYAFLMSSDPSADALKKAQEAGAIGVITKPFDRDELRRQLEAAERMAKSESGLSF